MSVCSRWLLVALTVILPGVALARSSAVVTQAVLDAEDHRRFDDPIFDEALAHTSSRVRAAAALALGRIGATENVAKLIPALRDSASSVRRQAAFALGLIGGDEAKTALIAQVNEASESDASVRREQYMALGRIGGDGVLEILSKGLLDAAALARSGSAQGLGFVFMKGDATVVPAAETIDRLLSAAAGTNADALASAFALARLKAPHDASHAAALIGALQNGRSLAARLQLIRAVGKLKTDAALDALLGLAVSDNIEFRVEIVRALGNFQVSERQLSAFRNALADESAQVVEQSLETLAQLGTPANAAATDVAEVVRRSASNWNRGQALITLATLDAASAKPLITSALNVDAALAPAALRALAAVGDAESLALVLPYLADSRLKVAGAAAEAVSGFDPRLLSDNAKTALRAALATGDIALVANAASIAAAANWQDFAVDLQSAYGLLTRADDVEGKVEILGALGKIGNVSHVTFLEAALADDERLVAVAAAEAIEAITGVSAMGRVPRASRVRASTPPLRDLLAATHARVRVVTTKGTIVLAMSDAAPFTAHNFVTLARAGFYDGKSFHRVVPSFVAQGGDPRGDGYGGPGYLIRDEVSTLSHTRGAVGIATAGKDTGGCQLFIDHAANPHLDGSYTIFAHVIRGFEVLDALEVDDVILSMMIF